jgi:hypothetical protein
MPYEGVFELAQASARTGHLASTKRVTKEPSKMGRKHQGNTARLGNGKLTGAGDCLVHEQSGLRFSARLETEHYPGTRSRLSKLLVAKENRFAVTAERLTKLDTHIAKCESFILLLHTLIDKLNSDGRDFQEVERSLRNTVKVHDLCLSYRRVLLHAVDRLTNYERQSHASRKLAVRRPRGLPKPPVRHEAPTSRPSSRRSV